MMYICISVGIFLCSIVIHILLHRVFFKYRIVNHMVLIYGIGVSTVIWSFRYLPASDVSLPLTALTVYILLSILLSIFYYSLIVLKGVPPSSVIMDSFKDQPKLTEKKIIDQLSETVLYDRRIENMFEDRWIVKKSGRLYIASKGNIIMTCIRMYERIFGWHIGG